jgi:hypothetical protein
MKFNVSFELQGTQSTPQNEEEREKVESKVYRKLKEILEVLAVDNNLVLRKCPRSLEVDLVR